MTKRAFLIGCNYTAIPSIQLNGCINDIVHVRNTLIDAYGYQDANIYMLRDDDKSRLPTRANILKNLTILIGMSQPADTLWVHYSGHGIQVKSNDIDEFDKLDECIVPCNYNIAGVIVDNELFAIFKNAKCQLIICFDSCNSGTGCDLQYSMNYNNGLLSKATNNSKYIADTNIIMFSGCRDSQTSADAYDSTSRQSVGAFTQTFLETLRSSDHNIALIPFYMNLCANLKSLGFTQIPVLSSTIPSPSFQFSRANSNGSSVVSTATTASTTTKKELELPIAVQRPPLKSAAKSLRGLMASLIGR
jgi:hypothetical protein